jgi:antitoxin component of RelBE/YafQ-DinJ toxin-antitoxin module
MTANLSTVTFRANAEDIEACRLVFHEYGMTLEEGVILFLRHVAETRKLPDCIEQEIASNPKYQKIHARMMHARALRAEQ